MSTIKTTTPGWGYCDAPNQSSGPKYSPVSPPAEPTRCDPTEVWVTSDKACDLLGLPSVDALSRSMELRRRSRSVHEGKSCRGVGALFYRPDIERVNAIRRECRVGFSTACRVLAALRDGRI